MDPEVQELKDDHGQGEAILLFLARHRHTMGVQLGRQVLRRVLRGREALLPALDAEAVAVEHRHVQESPMEPQVDRLQIDHAVALAMQLCDQRAEVRGQRRLGAEPGR